MNSTTRKEEEKTRFQKIGETLYDFFGMDLRTLAVLRILTGILVLWTIALLYRDVVPFFTDQGVYPREYWLETRRNAYIFSLHMVRGELWWQNLLFGIHAIFATMLIFGHRTRMATIGTWVLLVSLMARNPLIITGADTLLCCIALWGIFVPWGARFSIDGALNTVTSIPKGVVSFGTAGLILQMPLVYFFSALLKTTDPSWHSNYTAVGYALAPEWVTGFGAFVGAHQPFWMSQFLTGVTIAIEFAAPILAFFPLLLFVRPEVRRRWLERFRWVALMSFLGLQFGLLLTIAIGLFPLVSTLGILVLLPASFWDRISSKSKAKDSNEITIFYDPDCGFCKKMVLLIREFFLPRSTTILAADTDQKIFEKMQKEQSWILRDETGNLHLRFDAFVYLLQCSPWAYPLAPLASRMRFIGDPVYRWVARNRKFMGRFTRSLDYGAYHVSLGIIMSLVAALLLTSMITSNIDSVTEKTYTPREIRLFQRGIRFHQNWRMFVRPNRWVSFYVIHATMADGREVDLFGDGGPISTDAVAHLTWERPPEDKSLSYFKNYRWRKYIHSLRGTNNREDRRYYAAYMCRTWNREHSGRARLHRIRFYRVVQTKDWLFEEEMEEYERRMLWRHWCYGYPGRNGYDDDD